jgi:hypothetical protein
MKKETIFVLIFMSLFNFSTIAQTCKPNIIGAWRCVRSVHGGVKEKVEDVVFIKYITKTSFTWVSSSKETQIVRSAMGGTCSYDGKIYVENIAFIGPGMTRFLNKKHTFNVDITGSKMHLYGTMSDKVYIDEIWVRVDRE